MGREELEGFREKRGQVLVVVFVRGQNFDMFDPGDAHAEAVRVVGEELAQAFEAVEPDRQLVEEREDLVLDECADLK